MDSSRKCRWRKQEAERVRQYRVTQGYIEKKYPHIYKEALEFYSFLDQKYPGKRDLRKTNEFEWLKTGISGETCKKYYSRKTTTRTTTMTTVIDDRMELVIPLIRKENVPSTETAVISENVPSTETAVIPENVPSTEIAVIPENVPSTETAVIPENVPSTEIAVIPEITPTLEEAIPDCIMDNIMAELCTDPNLERLLNSFEDYFDGEELMCQ